MKLIVKRHHNASTSLLQSFSTTLSSVSEALRAQVKAGIATMDSVRKLDRYVERYHARVNASDNVNWPEEARRVTEITNVLEKDQFSISTVLNDGGDVQIDQAEEGAELNDASGAVVPVAQPLQDPAVLSVEPNAEAKAA